MGACFSVSTGAPTCLSDTLSSSLSFNRVTGEAYLSGVTIAEVIPLGTMFGEAKTRTLSFVA